MEGVVTQIIGTLSPSALPVVVLCLGGLYLWFKFGRIEKDREDTKQQRDKDSQNIHDEILKHSFEITNLKGIVDLHKSRLESIDHQLSVVNEQLVRLNMSVEHLSASLKEQNEIMKAQLQKGQK